MKLKDYCNDERPRERLLEKGAESLSNTELLAIMLNSGTGNKNVMELAREILVSSGGNIRGVASLTVDGLCSFDGVGPAKAAILSAAFELGRRYSEERFMNENVPMSNPRAVYRMMLPIMKKLDHEECWIIFLNRRNLLIGKEKITSGDDGSTVIDNKAIARRAMEKKAAALILVHNHPSGNALPSVADINQTSVLKRMLNSCEIPLLDHVIVAGDTYYSFADEELVHCNAGK